MICSICENWCAEDVRLVILTGHHPRCPQCPDPVKAALKLIAELALGMEKWAAEEDGIYPDAWEAYRRAKALEGVYVPAEPEETK